MVATYPTVQLQMHNGLYKVGLVEDVDISFRGVKSPRCVQSAESPKSSSERLLRHTTRMRSNGSRRMNSGSAVEGQKAADLCYPRIPIVLGSHREYLLNGQHHQECLTINVYRQVLR